MQKNYEAALLRIYVGESDKYEGEPLYETIVLTARKHGLAGATVLRGPMGFGYSSKLHTFKILQLSEDLPILIEIVDYREKIDQFLPTLEKMAGSSLITLEKVQIVRYGHK